jgi:hypothetical protein
MDKLRQWMRTSAKSKSEGQLDLLKRPIQSLFLWIILVNIVLILVIGERSRGEYLPKISIVVEPFARPLRDQQLCPVEVRAGPGGRPAL